MGFDFEKQKSPVVTMGIKWKKQILIILGIVCVVGTLYIIDHVAARPKHDYPAVVFRQFSVPDPSSQYTIWKPFEANSGITLDYFSKRCGKQKYMNLTGLVQLRQEWAGSRDNLCRELYNKFSNIFTLEERHATLKIPKPFQAKVRSWLGNNELLFQGVYDQNLFHIINHFTHEHTIFNPIRDKRPSVPPDVPEDKYLTDIMASSAKTCDFCNFKNFTAEHVFGRIESKYAFTASNIFKLDGLHALIAMKQHNPLNWDQEHFLDAMQLTLTWLAKAHKHVPDAHYPAGIWDVLPRCAASQVHPHIHMIMDPHRHHGEIENWREGAQDYYEQFHSNYFSDLVNMYTVLNLTASYGNAVAFANLVPKRDHEVVVMAEEPSEDFFKLLYFVLRAFIDDLGKHCHSMGIAYPAFGIKEGKIPAYARVVTRGAVTDPKADVSSFELFLATNVNIDPYKTIQYVRESIAKRK